MISVMALAMAAIGCGGSEAAASGRPFTQARLRGTYTCVFDGAEVIGGQAAPLRARIVLTSNGAGEFSGGSTIIGLTEPDGTATTCNYTVESGTYTVDADGAGSWTVNHTASPGNASSCPPAAHQAHFVLSRKGHTIIYHYITASGFVGGGTCTNRR